MSDYVIMTDCGCDIRPEMLKEWEVGCADLTFRKADQEKVYTNKDIDVDEFYGMMREGTMFQTAAANPEEYIKAFEKELKNGKNIIYIGLSTGISRSAVSAQVASDEISPEKAGLRIEIIDSLCASAGLGLLVYLAVKKRNAGAGFDELAAYLREMVPRMCHWFTVDDLKYLKNGGRISSAAAFTATVLDIKPVMRVDDEGRLTPSSKVRGRRQAIKALADKYVQLSDNIDGEYFISNADCAEDAKLLESMIYEKKGRKADLITDIGPVIGAHAGPGTLALFFIGEKR